RRARTLWEAGGTAAEVKREGIGNAGETMQERSGKESGTKAKPCRNEAGRNRERRGNRAGTKREGCVPCAKTRRVLREHASKEHRCQTFLTIDTATHFR